MPGNDELIQHLKAAIALAPEALPLRKHLAELLMSSGQLAEAVQEYKRALELEPEDDALKLALAKAYLRNDQADVTLVVLQEYLRRPVPTPQVLMLASRAYLQTGDPAQAAQAYRRAVAQDASLADAELEQQLPLDLPSGPKDKSKDDRVFVTVEGEAQADTPVEMLERPRITFNDVGGMDKLKEEIRIKIIYPISHPELYKAYGKGMGGGILMYGPPGCGKTFLARATAGEVKAHFIAVGIHDVLDMYMGQSEQKLHAIFDLARSNTPCVLFFDEVDALGAKRSDMRYSGIRQVINQFLMELDGVDTSNEGVLILAATNAPWSIDAALRRPGRFDRVIFVPPPDGVAREAILHLMLAGKPTDKLDYSQLAQATLDFSGADLRGVVDVAVEGKLREAIKAGKPSPLTMKDLQAALKAAHPTAKEWFETARNYAIYSNQGGIYDDILSYLKISGGSF